MDILIDREIGGPCGVTAAELRSRLAEAKDGEDVRICVDSPGGDCFEGFAVYNAIRDFARGRKAGLSVYIQGMAASAASWVALAASSVSGCRVSVEDNSVFMIHNCWGVAVGDRRAMMRSAELSGRIDGIMAEMLARKSGKEAPEISAMMDEETWLFGKEIVDAGFADELIEDKERKSGDGGRENSLVLARKRFADCQSACQKSAETGDLGISSAFAALADEEALETARKKRLQEEETARARLASARLLSALAR